MPGMLYLMQAAGVDELMRAVVGHYSYLRETP